MEIARIGTRVPEAAPPAYFTGRVTLETLAAPAAPARVQVVSVSFAAGARTTWHTHPLGQTLVVTEGVGWVQLWGAAPEPIRPGDVVWIPPGEKHWHGAAAASPMTHLAIQERQDGKAADWLEPVTDEQYPA